MPTYDDFRSVCESLARMEGLAIDRGNKILDLRRERRRLMLLLRASQAYAAAKTPRSRAAAARRVGRALVACEGIGGDE